MDSAKVAKITGHRFEGYTPGMLAIEVEQFQAGQGASSIAEAVEALKAVATALADTDETLRTGLDKIGVAWQSSAAEQAKVIFGGQADFAGDAKSKVNNTAQVAFVLSEAYSSMVNKLPDPATLRAGDDGLHLGDVLSGLIGHETDHAAQVKAARAARDQAVDAITEFQQTASEELTSVEVLGTPENLVLDGSPGAGPTPDPGDASLGVQAMSYTGGLAPDAGTASTPEVGKGETVGASAGSSRNSGRGTVGPGTVPDDCPPEAKNQPVGHRSGAAPAESTRSTEPSGATAPSEVTPPPVGGVGVVPGPAPGASTGTGTPGVGPGGPSGPGAGAPGAPGTPGGAGGVVIPPAGTGSSGSGASTGTGTPGGKPGGGTIAAPGASGSGGGSGAAAGKFGGGDSSRGFSGGKFGAGLPGGAPESADPLAKGKFTGATPPPPAATTAVPPLPPAAAAAAGSGAGLASGAAAIGAAAVGAATSGEDDREHRNRGYGRNAEVDGRPLNEFEVGDRADDEDARNVEKLEPDATTPEPKFLEQAAMPPGVTEDTRVRTHGVDDVDLFADPRMAAPEIIGDDPAQAYNANRAEPPRE